MADVVSIITGIPVNKVAESESQKLLNLPTTAAQAKKTDAGRVASKIRTKDISPTDINKEIEVGVSTIKDSKGNITSVKFLNSESG